MRFSELLSQLSEVTDASLRHLADDPELHGAAALDQAQADQLTFLEPGNALAAALAGSNAGAILLPARGDEAAALQQLALERGMAWIALADPRLAFAEALAALHPRQRFPVPAACCCRDRDHGDQQSDADPQDRLLEAGLVE